MRIPVIASAVILAAASAAATSAPAASLILGWGKARVCYEAARAADTRGPAAAAQIAACNEALGTEALSVRDRAGTYVNRGI